MESLKFPLCQWVNCRSGATEFTATIHPNNLVYLDWKPVHSVESANISMAELHSWLNHMPCSAIQHLVWVGTLAGLPDHVTSSSKGDFCKDCVNGKLTRAPHTKPAAHAEWLLLHIFSDVHGPLPMHSQHGHLYWVTFINDHSCFPVVYFITRKSNIFNVFCKYKAWAENLTGHCIEILQDNKGGEYVGRSFTGSSSQMS